MSTPFFIVKRRNLLPNNLAICALLLATCITAFAQTDPLHVASPDGQLVMRLFIMTPKDSRLVRLAYQVSYRGKLLMDTSLLGIAIHDQEPFLGENVGLVESKAESVDETYKLPLGKRLGIRNHYNSLIAQYIQNGSLGRRVTIEARAYDDGVAFRYYIPRTSTVEDLQIEEELTDFRFAQDGQGYPLVLQNYQSASEGDSRPAKLSTLKRTSLIGLPFPVEQPGVGWVAITEAQIDNYPGMYVFHPEGTTMRTTLAPRLDDAAIAMHGMTPAETPWRVLMVASEPRKFLDSEIVRNLNPAPAMADTSWIKPANQLFPIEYSAQFERQIEQRFSDFEKRGEAGVKIDLLNRSDQQMIDFYRRAAKSAAAHHLMIEFENAPTSDGIERTWPNVLPREDVAFTRLLGRF